MGERGAGRSNPIQLRNRPFILKISGIQRRLRFEQNHMRFFISDRQMLDASRHDEEFTLAHKSVAVAKFHAEHAFYNEKELVFIVVMMPDEFAFKLGGFYIMIVQFADDFGTPILSEHGKLF